jgi:hypothetical protein
MKKITLILFMLSAFVISSCESVEDEPSSDEQTIDNSGNNSNSGTGTGTGSSIYNGSSPTGNYWSRNDGMGTASLSLSGTTAKACTDGKETIGSFNSAKPSMTFTIGKDVFEFPLLFTNGKLYVGAPAQAVDTHNAQTQYISDTKYNCGSSSGGTTTSAKGTIMVWSDVPEYGFKYGFNAINVRISSVSDTGTVFGGAYTSEPSCGATYCFTKEVEPGSYTVTGKIYPLQPLSGPKPTNYTVSYTVIVVSNKCTKVVMR